MMSNKHVEGRDRGFLTLNLFKSADLAFLLMLALCAHLLFFVTLEGLMMSNKHREPK